MGTAPREQWSGRAAFVLATVASAVGLGNIWRFSYVAGENGGGAFLLAYLPAVAILGLPLMVAEFALGRRSRADIVSAYAFEMSSPRWAWAGWLAVGRPSLFARAWASARWPPTAATRRARPAWRARRCWWRESIRASR